MTARRKANALRKEWEKSSGVKRSNLLNDMRDMQEPITALENDVRDTKAKVLEMRGRMANSPDRDMQLRQLRTRLNKVRADMSAL